MLHKYSQLQLKVIRLYRDFYRLTLPPCHKNEPTCEPTSLLNQIDIYPENRKELRRFVRTEFRRYAYGLSKTDLQRIEYLVRQGERKLEALKQDSITRISKFTL